MSIEWAGLGPQLLLRLDRGLAQPLRAQLERELRQAIRSGRLSPGERLPSSRQLAHALGLSRGLVQESYAQLQAEGYLTARTGSATRVATGAHGVSQPLANTRVSPPLAVDFRPGRPDLSSFPRRDWMWALREVSRTAPADALAYADPRGSQRLREVLASYVRRVRGAVADPELIVICAGFAQGLNLLLRVLARASLREVAFEDPGDTDQRLLAERIGLGAIAVPVDSQGVDVRALAASGAGAVLLTPAHQFPTGVVLGPERRQAVVDWAVTRAAIILEDDYDAEFRYDRDPVGLLQGLAPEHVAALGTVSKSLAPGLRLGWIICPPSLVNAVAEEKELADRGSPGLDQLALASLIESGRFDRHLRRMRAVYAARRQILVQALAQYAPNVVLQGLAAGFHAVADLPDGLDEERVVAAARERSIGLYPMNRYRASGTSQPPQLVLGFGNINERSIERAVASVSDLLRPLP